MGLGLTVLLLVGTQALTQAESGPHPHDEEVSPGSTAAVTLTRGPYLQSATTNSVIVVWRTDAPATSWVDYGPTAAYGLVVSNATPAIHHTAFLTGLSSYSIYHYRISGNGQFLGEDGASRAAASPTQTTFSFVAFGDTRTDAEAHQTVVDRIVLLSPDFVLHTGDFVADGNVSAQWTTFFTVEQNLLRRSPLFGAIGNHEQNSANYFDAFYLPGNERWYSFDYGHAHFVVLQIDGYAAYAPGSAQYNWLNDDLAGTDKLWKIVSFHIPPYSSGSHGGSAAVRDALAPLLAQHSVDLVFNGHDHDYERSVVTDVVYVVTGGGGAPLGGQANANPYAAYFTSTYHCVSVTVDGWALTGAAIRPDGVHFDSFTITATANRTYLPLVLRSSEKLWEVQACVGRNGTRFRSK